MQTHFRLKRRRVGKAKWWYATPAICRRESWDCCRMRKRLCRGAHWRCSSAGRKRCWRCIETEGNAIKLDSFNGRRWRPRNTSHLSRFPSLALSRALSIPRSLSLSLPLSPARARALSLSFFMASISRVVRIRHKQTYSPDVTESQNVVSDSLRPFGAF
jgi:hypothetical protein